MARFGGGGGGGRWGGGGRGGRGGGRGGKFRLLGCCGNARLTQVQGGQGLIVPP